MTYLQWKLTPLTGTEFLFYLSLKIFVRILPQLIDRSVLEIYANTAAKLNQAEPVVVEKFNLLL